MAVGPDQAIEAPAVLFPGASSQIGVFAIPRLIAAGFNVIAISRKGRPGHFPVDERVRWINPDEAPMAAGNCRYLLSAGPLELARKLMLACDRLESAVVFSSSSVETKQTSGNPAERSLIGNMQTRESELCSISENRGSKLVIFRPTLVYGCGMDTNISRLARWIERFGFIPVNTRATGLRQPVHADDLAEVAVRALQSRQDLPRMLNLCGGETLSYADMAGRIFSALGKPVRLLRLPEWLFAAAVNAAGAIRPGSGLNGEMVRRQRFDLVFDDRPARDLLGYDPRPFRPSAADFALPEAE